MGEDTLDDLLTTAMGRVVRFSRPVGESYQPMTIPFTAQYSFQAMELFDKMKRDRTGITQESEGSVAGGAEEHPDHGAVAGHRRGARQSRSDCQDICRDRHQVDAAAHP